MIAFLSKFFIENPDDTENPTVRARYASITGTVGIILNIFLFITKGLIGLYSGYISIIADAFNNLSDAASSIVTMIGFRVASIDPDSDHPFGHGRSEYISGLIVSFFILLVGFELIKSSITKIIHPTENEFSIYLVIVLIISILVKLYMFYYNTAISKKLSSAALKATAKDSINDVFVTLAVLISAIIGHLTSLNIDGFAGIVVGIFIIKGGIDVFIETSGLILGHGVDPEFKKKIYDIVGEYDGVLGVHDLVVHDYGPGRRVISLHAEVDAKEDILEIHDMIDVIEHHLQKDLHAQAIIHMDPIISDDEEINRLKALVIDVINELDTSLTIHDFRVVKGSTHTNLIFDVLLPFESKLLPDDASLKIAKLINEKDNRLFSVITIDRPA